MVKYGYILYMTEAEGMLKLQNFFGINPIYSRTVFDLADKDNLIEDAAKIISARPKPFVKWVGGKRQLLKQFFEPFVGGELF